MTSTAVAPESDGSEEHLHPSHDGPCLAEHSVRTDGPRPEGSFVDVEFKIYTEKELSSNRSEEDVRVCAVRAVEELSALVCMTKDVASKGECEASDLSTE